MDERERKARYLCEYHDIEPDREVFPVKEGGLGEKVNDKGPYKLWEYWAMHYVDVLDRFEEENE